MGENREKLPQKGLMVTIAETGMPFVNRYLSQFGYQNIIGLQFGMYGWIKLGDPVR